MLLRVIRYDDTPDVDVDLETIGEAKVRSRGTGWTILMTPSEARQYARDLINNATLAEGREPKREVQEVRT